MGDGGCHLVFDDIGLQSRLVAAGPLIVFLRPHIVPELGYFLSAAAVVAAIGHSPVLMPLKNRAETVLFLQLHDHSIIVQTDFHRLRAVLLKDQIQVRPDIIALPSLKFFREKDVPQSPADIEVQLIRKEKDPTFPSLSGGAEGIIAQADRDSPFLRFLYKPA